MKKILSCLILIFTILLGSCSKANNEKVTYLANPIKNSEGQFVQLYNSSISLTAYNPKLLNKISPLFQEVVEDIHIASDRYNYFLDDEGKIINNLKVINDNYGKDKPIKINDYLFDLLDLALDITSLSEGYFNPTMGVLIDYYEDYMPTVPGQNKPDIVDTNSFKDAFNHMIPYDELDPLSNYIVLDETNKTVTFKKYKDIDNIKISLGGIAKGYGMYKAELLFKDYKDPIMIDGGSSSLALLNKHPINETYKIGVSSPYGSVFGQDLIYALNLKEGTNISTSGDYLHYYNATKKNEKIKTDLGENKYRYIRRHHILNPFKGYSENYYRVINLNADGRADVLDALSTILFNIDIVNDKDTFDRIINNFENTYNLEINYLLEQEYTYLDDKFNEINKLDIYMNEGMESLIDKGFKTDVNYIDKVNIVK